MKQSLNSNSIPSIQIICLVMALTAATITQSGCSDTQPGSDANVSIEEGNGGNQENESVGATKEEWFQTESVDGGVAIKMDPEKAQGCEKIVIPSKIGGEPVVKINNEAFYQCSSLKSVVIPEGVTEIGDFAFMDCSSLTSVVIPEGVKEIGMQAFGYCSSMTSVVIPKSLSKIGGGAFWCCSALTSVDIPMSVAQIGASAFEGCSSLTSVVIPEGVTEIGSQAFGYCSSMTSVVISKSVQKIGKSAFAGCVSLTSVVIPEGVTEIGTGAFYGSRVKVEVDPKNSTYSSVDGVLFDKDKKTLRINDEGPAPCAPSPPYVGPAPCEPVPAEAAPKPVEVDSEPSAAEPAGNEEPAPCAPNPPEDAPKPVEVGSEPGAAEQGVAPCEPVPPADMTKPVEVGSEEVVVTNEEWFQTESVDGGVAIKLAPEKAQGCEKVVIPSQIGGEPVVKINNEAFIQCLSLTSVVIPEGVTEIGDVAFFNCPSLTSVVIPEGVKEIGHGAFGLCFSLPSVVIPKSVQNIGGGAFCGSSVKVEVDPQNAAYSSVDGILFDKDKKTLLHVPTDVSAEAYSIPEGVEKIGDAVFNGCYSLKSVVIPEGVKEIGNGAFAACSSLTNVVIPKSVQNIGDAAFAGCSSLTSVVIPKSVTEIGGNAFDDCPAKLRVYKESYAEKWARDNNLVHETIEGNDGANNEGAVRSEESEPAPSAPNPPEDAPEPIEIGSEPSATEPAENVLREWTDSTGKYRIKATFEEQDGSNVKLRREDGKRIVMPISKLSDADRDYLDNL